MKVAGKNAFEGLKVRVVRARVVIIALGRAVQMDEGVVESWCVVESGLEWLGVGVWLMKVDLSGWELVCG